MLLKKTIQVKKWTFFEECKKGKNPVFSNPILLKNGNSANKIHFLGKSEKKSGDG